MNGFMDNGRGPLHPGRRQRLRPMPRKLIRRYLPDSDRLRELPVLRRFGVLVNHPRSWRINRRSVAGGVANGLFWALLPMPFQMVAAVAFALIIRVNLPISLMLVWLTNPLTMPPVFYFNYKVGTWVLGVPARRMGFDESLSVMMDQMMTVWQPLAVGSLVVATTAAFFGWATTRILWRWHVVSRRWPSR